MPFIVRHIVANLSAPEYVAAAAADRASDYAAHRDVILAARESQQARQKGTARDVPSRGDEDKGARRRLPLPPSLQVPTTTATATAAADTAHKQQRGSSTRSHARRRLPSLPVRQQKITPSPPLPPPSINGGQWQRRSAEGRQRSRRHGQTPPAAAATPRTQKQAPRSLPSPPTHHSINASSLNAAGPGGLTPLLLVCMEGRLNDVAALLALNADPAREGDVHSIKSPERKYKCTPLVLAARDGDLGVRRSKIPLSNQESARGH